MKQILAYVYKGNTLIKRIIAILLLIIILLGNINNAFAYKINVLNTNPIETRVSNNSGVFMCADKSTVDSYKNIITNSEQGGRYNGRIWTDKSVYAHDEISEVTLDNKFNINYDEDFLHVFSALGSSQTLVGLPPAKTIIVIDNSGSMYGSSNVFKDTRVYKTVTAVNEAIDTLMRAGAYNEVGVVLFGNGMKNEDVFENINTAKLIIPIGHYPVSDNKEKPYQYLDTGWIQIKSNSKEYIIPEKPMQEYDEEIVDKDKGCIYVDKAYVNDNFEVDNDLMNKQGFERYDTYRNGTTNIQAGYYEAFKSLLNTDKYVTVDEYKFNYVPSIVFLTDGEFTDMLDGPWYKPEINNNLVSKGFINDFSDKGVSFVGDYINNSGEKAYSWNQFIEEYTEPGEEWRFKLIGEADINNPQMPSAFGINELLKFSESYQNSKEYVILSTLLMVAYYKKIIKIEYGEECNIYTISVDMEDLTDPELNARKNMISCNGALLNPNLCFNEEWLKKCDYLVNETDSGSDGTYYETNSVASLMVLAMYNAIRDYEKWKRGEKITTDFSTYIEIGSGNNQGITSTWERRKYIKNYSGTPAHSSFYLVKRSQNNYDVSNINDLIEQQNPYNIKIKDIDVNYVKQAYYVKSTSETLDSIKNVFTKVVDDIIEPPFIPIGNDVNEAGTPGVLSYVDPIGKYMEIKDVNKLLLFGKEYNIIKDGEVQKEIINDQTIIRQYYKAVGIDNEDLTINNASYGEKVQFNLSGIKIWKEISNNYDTGEGRDIDTSFDEALHVTIPKEAIPIIVDTIEYDRNGKIISYTNNAEKEESLPLRIIYEVGISANIMNERQNIDLSKLSQEYFREHKKKIEGKDYIEFLSNYYSEENYNKKVNNTFGNAASTFTPSPENRFYLFQKNSIIYKNSTGGDKNGEGELIETGGTVNLTEEVKNLNEIEKDKTYYFTMDYYAPYNGIDGSKGKLVKYSSSCKGSDFYGKHNECYLTYYDKTQDKEVDGPNENTVIATKIGGRKICSLERISTNKEENITETANTISFPQYGGPLNEDCIVDYLGNNGRLVVSATWLFINKIVNTNVDKNYFYKPTNEEFEFKLDIDGNIGTENAIVYGIYAWNGESWIPEKDKTYVITDNEGYILTKENERTLYWVGNSEKERLINEDGTITVYKDNSKIEGQRIQIFSDEEHLESLYKITSTLKTKRLVFTPTESENIITTTFTLKDGEGLLLSGLLPETKWTVTENLKEDQINKNFAFDNITGRQNDKVTIKGSTISGITEAGLTDEANYRNSFIQYFKTLTIEKIVKGKSIDKEKEWEFEVKLIPEEDVILYDEYKFIGGNSVEEVEPHLDGKIVLTKTPDGISSGSIKLKHGQTVTIKDLPQGTEYEIIEKEANLDNYTTTSTNEKGILDTDKIAKFENAKKTIEFEFTKVKNENINEMLPGTKFRLYKLICTIEEEHNQIIDINNVSTCWELYDEVVSDENGKVVFADLLPKQEYRLIEVETAEDRIKPDGQWNIKYNSYEENVQITAIAGKKMPPAFIVEDGRLLLPNMAIYVLPISGSAGTKIFTQIGLGLIAMGIGIIYFGNPRKKKGGT